MSDWKHISTLPTNIKMKSVNLLLCHDEYKWIRFGRYFPLQKEWYYSGTNERSQWAQTKGDEPTHYQEMPKLPAKE